MKASELHLGEHAIIMSLTDGDLSLQLQEMNCLPGQDIKLERKAPLGDPLVFSISGHLLSLRKKEAEQIMVGELIHH